MFITTAGGGLLAATVLGGVMGGNKGLTGGSNSQTQTNQMDPKVAEYVYGLLGNANDLYKKQSANGGLNDLQRAGLQQQVNVLSDPNYTSGFNAMKQMGLGLMGGGIAGNPWTGGNKSAGASSGASWGTSAPTQSYLPQGFNPAAALSSTTKTEPAPAAAQNAPAPSQFSPEELAGLQKMLALQKLQAASDNFVGGI